MKKVSVGLWTSVIGVGAVALAVATCAQQALLPQDEALLQQARVRAERLDTLYVTTRGRGIQLDGFASEDTVQSRVPQDLADRIVQRKDATDRVSLSLSIDGGPRWQMSMDAESPDEGRLFRLHIDRPDAGQCSVEPAKGQCVIKAIVIGYYDGLWTRGAVDEQKVKCIPCGEIQVCGSDPGCP